jgi:farnesyl-diphosphate farnesyltransferase
MTEPVNLINHTALRSLLKGVSRSFYLSIRWLPQGIQAPVAVGYLLARATDTVADTTQLPYSDRLQGLQRMAQAITSLGDLAHDLARWSQDIASWIHLTPHPEEQTLLRLWPICLQCLSGLPLADQEHVRAVLHTIVQGQMDDLERSSPDARPIDSQAELDHYTWQVAGSVGEFWTRVCEQHDPNYARLASAEMLDLGRSFGMGLQLLNILRDSGADLRSGRCYWPQARLAELGLTPQALVIAAQQGHSLKALGPLWQAYMDTCQGQLQAGLQYALAVRPLRLRLACALPALLGIRTWALLQQAGLSAMVQPVKMPRHEVRQLMWRLVWGRASRKTLTAQFQRLSAVRESSP